MDSHLLVGSFVGSTINHETKEEIHWWTRLSITLDKQSGKMCLQGYGNSYYGNKQKMGFILIGTALTLMEPIRMAKIYFNEHGQVIFYFDSFYYLFLILINVDFNICQVFAHTVYNVIMNCIDGKLKLFGDVASGILRSYEFKAFPP